MSTAPHLPGRALSLVGLLLLSHSAYSTYEHLSYLKATDKHEDGLPVDIIIECMVAIIIFMVGFTLVSGSLKPILMEVEMAKQTINKLDSRPSFQTFNHRGVYLHNKTK
ncbi:hypothetical protein K7432_010725 [Basidiobolus ranarum]|uniref:Membrane magnesium transporter n=1 Tax=Basidiobolus ranarum TaxID=34480 RepID=A0ABR2WNC2_9FUNG